MNSNVGVFGWIRDGVRRAVLLGFSDAVEQIGADEKDALHPKLQSLLREAPRRAVSDARPVEALPSRNERKRLGRTLGQTQVHNGGANTSLAD